MTNVKWIRWSWVVIVGLASLVAIGLWRNYGYQQSRAPATGTPEYKALHGVVQGQVSELWVGKYRYRFPAEINVIPESSAEKASEIVKGRADKVTVELDLSYLLDTPPLNARAVGSQIRVELARLYETPVKMTAANVEMELGNERWKLVEDFPALGLRRYVRQDEGSWGGLTYVPLDPRDRATIGGVTRYRCTPFFAGLQGNQPLYKTEPQNCSTLIHHPRGPTVWVHFGGILLPHWREMHREILKFIDSTLIEPKDH